MASDDGDPKLNRELNREMTAFFLASAMFVTGFYVYGDHKLREEYRENKHKESLHSIQKSIVQSGPMNVPSP